MRPEGITKVVFVDRLPGTTPATVNKRTGECYIVKSRWDKMSPSARLYMLLHENAHVALQTSDEFAADARAHEDYIRTGRSPKQSVLALSKVLSDSKPGHRDRVEAQLLRAIEYDKEINSKLKSSKMNEDITVFHPLNTGGFPAFTGNEEEWEDMSERRKRKQDRKDKKVEARIERKASRQESKNERKETKAEAKAYKKKAVGDSNVILAQQGINARAGFAKELLGGAAKVAGAVGGSIVGAKAVTALGGALGGGDNAESAEALQSGNVLLSKMLAPGSDAAVIEEQPTALEAAYNQQGNAAARSTMPQGLGTENPTPEAQPESGKKSNTMLYVGIAAVVLVLIVLFFLKK